MVRKATLFVFCAMFVNVCSGQSILSIGNSLTWDASPPLLDGNVAWHITCNKNLEYIYNNSEQFCLNSSTSWRTAMKGSSFDFVTVQPFTGTSLKKDSEIISVWMSNEPNAQFVLHTGWSSITALEPTYIMENIDDRMRHSLAYFEDLEASVRANHPNRNLISTNAVSLLYSIAQDVASGVGPIDDFSDLFRDSIHLDHDIGRYLMHNALRHAMGQPFLDDGFDIDHEVATYFQQKITTIDAYVEAIADDTPVPARQTTNIALIDTVHERELALAVAEEATRPQIIGNGQNATQRSPTTTTVTVVPEPGVITLLIAGLSALALLRR